MWASGLIYASEHLIQTQAYVFNNITSLCIVLVALCFGAILRKREWLGIGLVLLGLCVMCLDRQSVPTNGGDVHGSTVPAVLDGLSALFGALFISLISSNLKSAPVWLMLLILNVNTWFMNSLLAKAFDPSIQVFSTDAKYGCLGFLSTNNDLQLMFAFAVFASFLGTSGFILCFKVFSPIVVSSAMLVQPFFAQTWGYMLGIDKLPGTITVAATLTTICGIYFIEAGGKKRSSEEQENAEENKMTN